MASILRVNTLTDASSNNSTDTSVVFGGTAKAWCKTTGVGTPALGDSHNMASVTDHGTGLETFQFTAAMVNALFSTTAQGHLSGTVITIQQLTDSGQTPTTARTCASVHSVGASSTDCNKNITVHGDLA